jgi:hypothetical protein
MKIKIIEPTRGAGGTHAEPGDVIEVSEMEGNRIISTGRGEEFKEPAGKAEDIETRDPEPEAREPKKRKLSSGTGGPPPISA